MTPRRYRQPWEIRLVYFCLGATAAFLFIMGLSITECEASTGRPALDTPINVADGLTLHVLVAGVAFAVLLSMWRPARQVASAAAVTVIVLCLATIGEARCERWTAADSASQAVVLTALAADYLQTRQIVSCAQTGERCSDPDAGHLEANPVMGERGQRVPVPIYFLGVAALHTAAARVLPQPWRRISQVALLGIQVKSIGHNMSYGYSISF